MSGHKHHHTGCDGDDRHDETPEMGIQYSLFRKIDRDNLECLNEKVQHSGKEVFKAWEDRLSTDKVGIGIHSGMNVLKMYFVLSHYIYFSLLKVMLMKNCYLIFHLLET